MRILIANEPRSYREVIAAALRVLRPNVETVIVEPGELEREVVRLQPDLTLCSELDIGVERMSLSWVLLYPDGSKRTVTCVGGEQRVADDLALEVLLSVVDRTEVLLTDAEKR